MAAGPSGLEVLVIDDEERVLEVIVEALTVSGYTALGLQSAGEALDRIGVLSPSLIVLDMMMPGVDGFEFLARLRAAPVRSTVPVLITSALGDTLHRAIDDKSARALGVVGVLVKPVKIGRLLEHVRLVLGGGRDG